MLRRWLLPLTALSLLTMLIVACTGSGGAGSDQLTQQALQTATDSSQATAAPQGTSAVPAGPTPMTGDGPWPVDFTSGDGTKLNGVLYGKGKTGVVLAPMYPGGKEGWASFAKSAAAQGYSALAFDLRGYGSSEGTRSLPDAPADVKAAVGFLKKIISGKVVVVGAGFGGMASVKAVAGDDTILGLVIISSPQSFGGLEVSSADLSGLTIPSLWLAARNDLTQNIEDMYGQAGGKKNLWVYEGSSLQGTYILEGADGPDLQRRLLEFVAGVAGK